MRASVWLEDMRASTTTMDKLRAAFSAGSPLAKRQPNDPAVVLFTSGSEGKPKGRGVVARQSSRQHRSDRNALRHPAHRHLLQSAADVPCLRPHRRLAAWPREFDEGHSLSDPLHYREIPKAIAKAQATFLLGADTFLAHYARNADETAFKSLRYIVAGAEAVKAETRRLYKEKFGLAVLEAMAVTEASPVIAVNAPAFSQVGTVGRLLPFVEPSLEPVPGIEDGARLFIRGPNVMLGYYRPENPGAIERLPAACTTRAISSRSTRKALSPSRGAKRFAKIAGRDGVARFGRGSRRRPVARPCHGGGRGARSQARRARDPCDHQSRAPHGRRCKPG